MNLRVLKKKSKQAARILVRHYGERFGKGGNLYFAARHEDYHEQDYTCKRCWRKRPRFGCDCMHPLKGTPMWGAMSGYYEPEFEGRTAYYHLCELVIWGDKPATMTDAQWQETLRLTAITQEMIESNLKWAENQ
jgi:hypothetical protein